MPYPRRGQRPRDARVRRGPDSRVSRQTTHDEDWRYGVPKFMCETFLALDGTRRDINGRIVADSEVDAAGYLKVPPKPDYVPPGIEPLTPAVPHPRATKPLGAVEPVDRPLAQAIYEAKHAAAQQAAAEGRAYTPPKGGFAPSPPIPPPHGPAVTGAEMEQLREKMTREEHARREADRKAKERWEAREPGEKPEAGSLKPEARTGSGNGGRGERLTSNAQRPTPNAQRKAVSRRKGLVEVEV